MLLKITLVTSWKKARKLIKKDPRYELYGEDDKVTFVSFVLLDVVRIILPFISTVHLAHM